jgi:fructose-bisphosphate aldolase class 1
MYEETLYQKAADGTPIVDLCKAQGIVPGIKTDKVSLVHHNPKKKPKNFFILFVTHFKKHFATLF